MLNLSHINFFSNFIIFKKHQNFYFVFYVNKLFSCLLFIETRNYETGTGFVNLLNLQSLLFNNNILGLYFYYFKIFSYVGKSYKILNYKTYLNASFNKSNINYVFLSKYVFLRYFKKTKFMLIFRRQLGLLTIHNFVKSIRKQNIFTHRGLKLTSIPVFKKKGKVSSYTSSIMNM